MSAVRREDTPLFLPTMLGAISVVSRVLASCSFNHNVNSFTALAILLLCGDD
jgi:hypothetical protein